MSINNKRRVFLKKLGMGGVAMSSIPSAFSYKAEDFREYQNVKENDINAKKNQVGRKYNSSYKEEYLSRVAFPIGGLGAGMFCLEGTGAISHMSVRNRPEIFHEPGMFAAISVKGLEKGAKVIEGYVPNWKIFGRHGTANGARDMTYGLPRFRNVEFVDEFPFATVNLKDEDLPLDVKMTGWSPFIPSDVDNSGLPVGALEYSFTNTGKKSLEVIFSYNSRNFMAPRDKGHIGKIDGGFLLSLEAADDKPYEKGDFAIITDQPESVVDYCWFRGGHWDPLTVTWNTIKQGEMRAHEPVEEAAPGASLYIPFNLKAGGTKTIRVMMGWYVPETDLHFGEVGTGSSGCSISPSDMGLPVSEVNSTTHKPWYSSKFKNVIEVVDYWRAKYEELYEHSKLFHEAFHSSTLPPEVMESVAANLTILKAPTVMRQFDGRLWCWEGCGDDWGCCYGSCTHVWNYAQAIPHLFPSLERTLRDTEFCEDQNEKGHQKFRANLPISITEHEFYSAADGQLGGIMKVYRDWRISGDDSWLERIYPMVKRSIDYCIRTWDPREKGVIEEPHHNTYDIEFWGADGMCTSFYLGALLAFRKIGTYLNKDVTRYEILFAKGKKYMETELYNGEFFFQDIQWTNLSAPDPVKESEKSIGSEYSEEALKILKKEGPKYQYGRGCLSDGILGVWIAAMCGIEHPLDRKKITNHLLSVHRYNLKSNLADHSNPQRPSYAVGVEGGLLLCTWPKGGKLSLPFIYSDEVWTGIEYQVASHLMLMGKVDEGLEIVRTCRDRYDGRIRNPFNEYECGSWYARAMSSYGLLQGLTGVRFDAVEKTLYIDSKIGDFTSFISTETGFGTVTLTHGKPLVDIKYGKVPIGKVLVSGNEVEFEKV